MEDWENWTQWRAKAWCQFMLNFPFHCIELQIFYFPYSGWVSLPMAWLTARTWFMLWTVAFTEEQTDRMEGEAKLVRSTRACQLGQYLRRSEIECYHRQATPGPEAHIRMQEWRGNLRLPKQRCPWLRQPILYGFEQPSFAVGACKHPPSLGGRLLGLLTGRRGLCIRVHRRLGSAPLVMAMLKLSDTA